MFYGVLLETTREMEQCVLVPPPRRCSVLLCFIWAEPSGQKFRDPCSAPSLLPITANLRLFPFSKTQDGTEGKNIWWHQHEWKIIAGCRLHSPSSKHRTSGNIFNNHTKVELIVSSRTWITSKEKARNSR